MRARVAMITGASRGIGRGIALELARHGCDIVACATTLDPDRREKGLFEVKERVEELGQQCLPVAGNLAKGDDRARLLREALDRFGRIDVLVNNAGVAPLERLDVLDTTEASFDRLMAINLRGPFFLTQAVAKTMLEQIAQGPGHKPVIVFVTSISAHTASPSRAEYCISKAGLSMAAQNFAVRLAGQGINVFELRPGIVATDMTDAVSEKYDKLIAEGLLLQPRWGEPEDIGKACAALVEGYFDYAPGAVIEIGGGFGVRRL